MIHSIRFFSAAGLTALFILISCHNPDDFALLSSEDAPAVDRFFTLSAVGDTILPADGFSAVELVARVRDVSEGAPDVVFTATAGSLRVGRIVRADSAAVPTNADGEARVELVSSPQAATARVRVAVAGVRPRLEQELSIHFVTVADEDILVFVDAPDSAFAHGLSLVPFSVQIAAALEGEERLVRFETTQGAFPFSPDSTSQVQIVRADAGGIATAYLRTPEQVGEALVRATVKTFFQEAPIRFVLAPTDSVLHFAEAAETAPADGQSLSQFSVKITPHLQRDADRTVVFVTTLGHFVLPDDDGSTVSVRADAGGIATAYLRSPTRFDKAFVRATIKGFVQQQILQFDWAGPDSIIVSLERGRPGLAAGEQMQIEAELIRLDGRGQVTEDLEVVFAAADSLGNPLEGVRFVDVTRTNALGQVTAVFAVVDTLYRGRASIAVRPARITSEVVGRAEVLIQ